MHTETQRRSARIAIRNNNDRQQQSQANTNTNMTTTTHTNPNRQSPPKMRLTHRRPKPKPEPNSHQRLQQAILRDHDEDAQVTAICRRVQDEKRPCPANIHNYRYFSTLSRNNKLFRLKPHFVDSPKDRPVAFNSTPAALGKEKQELKIAKWLYGDLTRPFAQDPEEYLVVQRGKIREKEEKGEGKKKKKKGEEGKRFKIVRALERIRVKKERIRREALLRSGGRVVVKAVA